ncbi:MAG: hypothetical protein LBF17_00195 [Mediterranea sp.]|nr:hypothetical protein [Mediterranea sp.]
MVLEIFLLGMPAVVFLAGSLVIWQAYHAASSKIGRTLHLRLLTFLLALVGVWSGRLLCILAPDVFNACFPVYSVVLLIMSVALWSYIRLLVSGKKQTAVWKHYILPVVCGVTVGILPHLFNGFMTATIPAMLYLNILHLAFALFYDSQAISMLLKQYRKNRQPDDSSFSPGWLLLLSAIIGVQLLNIILSVFTGEPESCAGLPYTVIGALLISFLTSTLVYRVICMETTLFEQEAIEECAKEKERKSIMRPPKKRNRQVRKRKSDEVVAPSFQTGSKLSRKNFEQYVSEAKPWLDPKCSITALAGLLKTNRTYVSAFIRKKYGMNFNGWVNDCRFKELEYLKSLPKYKDTDLRRLIPMAGFGTYQGYYLARKNAEKGVKTGKEEADE